jgi:hypothetical protein
MLNEKGLNQGSSISLVELRGMLANLAIENGEHWLAISKVDLLIGKFGPFRRIDLDDMLLLYKP